jgi:L-alanine-DL-glutamate epimerase-like enolase superfamily enzyme
MSHGVCRPVGASVLGEIVEGPADIARIAARVRYESMDLLQAAHTFSGVEMALWDLLGRVRGEPVWRLLGYPRSEPKLPYASVLFGDDAAETLARALKARAQGFRAVKCGWGPIGRGTAAADADHFMAAREGIGPDGFLMVDTGQIFGEDVERAAERLPGLAAARAHWFEEPFAGHAYEAYAALAAKGGPVRTAGGEAAHNVAMARHLMDYGRVGFVQIDTGRIGGIGPAKEVADLAAARGVTYVNHTFTTHLALSASLQPYAGLAAHRIAEYPAAPKRLAEVLARNPIPRDAAGEIRAPEAPGLGIEPDLAALAPYLVEAEITVKGKVLYRTPALA